MAGIDRLEGVVYIFFVGQCDYCVKLLDKKNLICYTGSIGGELYEYIEMVL